MYGTVARFKVKPGIDVVARFRELRATVKELPAGAAGEYVFRMDKDPNEYIVVVMFESREAYRAHSENPATSARFEQVAQMLAAPPEWHDGEVVYHESAEHPAP